MIRKGILGFVFAFVFLALGVFTLTPTSLASAETGNVTISRSDSNFTFELTGFSSQTSPLSPTYSTPVTIIDDEHGKEVNYAYYDWSKLKFFGISIKNSLTGNEDTFVDVKLLVSYKQTENLSENVGKERVIYEETISGNTLANKALTFHIDQPEKITENAIYGDGFGIYKFDLIYSYVDVSSGNANPLSLSLGEIYVAVMPDDIDTKSKHITFKTEKYSSNELLDSYYITFNERDYDYVNPCHIKWSVTGIGKDNTRYVMRESDKIEGDYRTALWESYGDDNEKDTAYDMFGKDFLFDSHNVEGRFDVTCTIYNSNGDIITTYSTTVSTIKDESNSYLWLYIALAILLVVIIIGIILIIVFRKKEKIW